MKHTTDVMVSSVDIMAWRKLSIQLSRFGNGITVPDYEEPEEEDDRHEIEHPDNIFFIDYWTVLENNGLIGQADDRFPEEEVLYLYSMDILKTVTGKDNVTPADITRYIIEDEKRTIEEWEQLQTRL